MIYIIHPQKFRRVVREIRSSSRIIRKMTSITVSFHDIVMYHNLKRENDKGMCRVFDRNIDYDEALGLDQYKHIRISENQLPDLIPDEFSHEGGGITNERRD